MTLLHARKPSVSNGRVKTSSAPIPLISLTGQFRPIRRELLEAVTRVLDSGSYILGPEVAQFEKEFARMMKAPFCLGVSSGTQALQIALEAAGVGPGDEVIVPAFTFFATAGAVSEIGAKPVFADIDPQSLTLDPAAITKKITPRTKAVIPVHLYGYPADLDSMLEIAQRHNLGIVEDCAQAHLTQYKGRPVGGIGHIGCFSFYPTKNLGAAGDAGAIATQDEKILETCEILRNIGQRPGEKYRHLRVGHNFRLDEIQAAILRVRLKYLSSWTSGRRRAAARYRRVLAGLPIVLPPEDQGGNKHTYHQFVIQTPRRESLAKHLSQCGIGTGVYYPTPLHLQPAYASLGHRPGDFPQSERASKEVLALPMYPDLSARDIDRIGDAIRQFFN